MSELPGDIGRVDHPTKEYADRDVVAELDRLREYCLVDDGKRVIARARDEIVTLRERLNAPMDEPMITMRLAEWLGHQAPDTQQAMQLIRLKALEEAAQLMERVALAGFPDFKGIREKAAAAIRALKERTE